MTRLFAYALLTVLLFGSFVAEGTEKTFSNDEVMEMMRTLQKEIIANDQKAQERIAALEAETKQLREDKAALTQQIQEITGWINDRQMDADSMFLATLSEIISDTEHGDPIIWDSAPINPGGHYSTETGAYTAPVNGYYQFSVTKEGDQYFGSFYFLVDEARYAYKDAYIPDSNSEPSGSATITIELTAGQTVRVENVQSTYLVGSDSDDIMYSWFTGGLVYAL